MQAPPLPSLCTGARACFHSAHRQDQAPARFELFEKGFWHLSCCCAHMDGIVGAVLLAAPVPVRLHATGVWGRRVAGMQGREATAVKSDLRGSVQMI